MNETTPPQYAKRTRAIYRPKEYILAPRKRVTEPQERIRAVTLPATDF